MHYDRLLFLTCRSHRARPIEQRPRRPGRCTAHGTTAAWSLSAYLTSAADGAGCGRAGLATLAAAQSREAGDFRNCSVSASDKSIIGRSDGAVRASCAICISESHPTWSHGKCSLITSDCTSVDTCTFYRTRRGFCLKSTFRRSSEELLGYTTSSQSPNLKHVDKDDRPSARYWLQYGRRRLSKSSRPSILSCGVSILTDRAGREARQPRPTPRRRVRHHAAWPPQRHQGARHYDPVQRDCA